LLAAAKAVKGVAQKLPAGRPTKDMGRRLLCLLTGLWFLVIGAFDPAATHEVRPALLQITQSAPGDYVVVWKQPTVGNMGLKIRPHLSSGVLEARPAREYSAPGFLIREWRITGGPGLQGQTLKIDGLSQSVTDVLVRIVRPDGETITAVIKPVNPAYLIGSGGPPAGPAGVAIPAYLGLGLEHIAGGVDHLAFVLALLLLIGPGWRIVKAISAFTLAHSITLGAAALGVVKVDSGLVEILIALSIVFVARELLRPRDAPPTLARRSPWIVALVFGLLHGLGFAGAVAEIGLPKGEELGALLLFNLGVEIGQLAFIGVALVVMAGLRRLQPVLPGSWTPIARLAPAYGIGGVAAFWLLERFGSLGAAG